MGREYPDLLAWIGRLTANQDEETGLAVLEDWVGENGPLPAGHRLMPVAPLGQGGGLAAENLVSVRYARCWLAGVARWEAVGFYRVTF